MKWQIIYVPFLPLIFTFIAFIGIAASSAGAVKYGELNWDPIALISHWDNRACRFFGAFSFALAALGVNISANSLSAANDLTALFPATSTYAAARFSVPSLPGRWCHGRS